MKLVAFLLLNTLAINALPAEEPSDFEKGLRVLLELELNKFESCLDEGKTDCDDSEVDNFLRLLDEGHPVTMATPDYPRNALRSGISAVVVVQVTVSHSGEVSRQQQFCANLEKDPLRPPINGSGMGNIAAPSDKAARKAALAVDLQSRHTLEREVYASLR